MIYNTAGFSTMCAFRKISVVESSTGAGISEDISFY